MFDVAAVAAWLRVTAPADLEVLASIVPAVTSFVGRCPSAPMVLVGDPPVAEWAPDTELGAKMLAGRLFRRRNSPAGVEAFTDGGATYVSRYDSDVARLLRIDVFSPPRVG